MSEELKQETQELEKQEKTQKIAVKESDVEGKDTVDENMLDGADKV